jgi:general secretion pathway protein H
MSVHGRNMEKVRASGRTGFTLLELVIVLFLITLILGLSTVFLLNTLPAYRFNTAIREISAMIRHAKALALIRGEKQTLTINLESRQYGIEGFISKDLPQGTSIRVIDPIEGEILTGTYPIFFYPSGGIEGGTIILTRDKTSVSIQPDPIVGSVVIK